MFALIINDLLSTLIEKMIVFSIYSIMNLY